MEITDRVISTLRLTSPLPRGHETKTNVYIGGKCGIFFISTPDLEISSDYHQIESWVVPTEVLYITMKIRVSVVGQLDRRRY